MAEKKTTFTATCGDCKTSWTFSTQAELVTGLGKHDEGNDCDPETEVEFASDTDSKKATADFIEIFS